MPWPITVNGSVYQASDFRGFGYVSALPNLVDDLAAEAADYAGTAAPWPLSINSHTYQRPNFEAWEHVALIRNIILDVMSLREGTAQSWPLTIGGEEYALEDFDQYISVLPDIIGSVVTAMASNVYFVNTSGNNANPGTSAQPWQNLTKVNATSFVPGDEVRFAGGQTFSGTLTPPTSGSATGRVSFRSYGTGKATISSGSARGVRGLNKEYITIKDLIVVGSGHTVADVSGVEFENNQAGNTSLKGPHVIGCDIHGYGWNGVSILGTNGRSGWDDFVVRDNDVHDCTGVHTLVSGAAGIYVSAASYANSTRAHSNGLIENNRIYDCPGTTASNFSTSGIFVAQTRDTVVQYNEAYGNGADAVSSGGEAVGIWAGDATGILFQFNESHDNLGEVGGMDLDGGCINCTMQYNYIHDNPNYGMLVYCYPDSPQPPAMTGNVVRFNIFVDNNALGQGADIVLRADHSSGVQVDCYNNTIVSTSGSLNVQIREFGGDVTGHFCNNLLYNPVHGNLSFEPYGGALLNILGDPSITITGNCYAGAGDFAFYAGTQHHAIGSLFGSSDAVTQGIERIAGVFKGRLEDPKFVNVASIGGTTNGYDPTDAAITNLKLQTTSPIANGGLDISTVYGINTGGVDYAGVALPTIPSIGALQTTRAAVPADAAINATYSVVGSLDSGSANIVTTPSALRDGDPDTYYASNIASSVDVPQGAIADLGSSKTVTRVAITGGTGATQFTNGIRVAISTDASTWTDVGSIGGLTDSNLTHTLHIGQRPARYIRAQRQDDAGLAAAFAEFVIYGY